ncbi:hypothetical protein VCV18_006006 [Metarhizium anisopliae]
MAPTSPGASMTVGGVLRLPLGRGGAVDGPDGELAGPVGAGRVGGPALQEVAGGGVDAANVAVGHDGRAVHGQAVRGGVAVGAGVDGDGCVGEARVRRGERPDVPGAPDRRVRRVGRGGEGPAAPVKGPVAQVRQLRRQVGVDVKRVVGEQPQPEVAEDVDLVGAAVAGEEGAEQPEGEMSLAMMEKKAHVMAGPSGDCLFAYCGTAVSLVRVQGGEAAMERSTHIVQVVERLLGGVVCCVGERKRVQYHVRLLHHGTPVHGGELECDAILSEEKHVGGHGIPCCVFLEAKLFPERVGSLQRFGNQRHRVATCVDVVCILVLSIIKRGDGVVYWKQALVKVPRVARRDELVDKRYANVSVQMVLVVPARAGGGAVAKTTARPGECGRVLGKDRLVLGAGVAGLRIRLGLAVLVDAIVGDSLGRLGVRHDEPGLHKQVGIPKDETGVRVRHQASDRDAVHVDGGVLDQALGVWSDCTLQQVSPVVGVSIAVDRVVGHDVVPLLDVRTKRLVKALGQGRRRGILGHLLRIVKGISGRRADVFCDPHRLAGGECDGDGLSNRRLVLANIGLVADQSLAANIDVVGARHVGVNVRSHIGNAGGPNGRVDGAGILARLDKVGSNRGIAIKDVDNGGIGIHRRDNFQIDNRLADVKLVCKHQVPDVVGAIVSGRRGPAVDDVAALVLGVELKEGADAGHADAKVAIGNRASRLITALLERRGAEEPVVVIPGDAGKVRLVHGCAVTASVLAAVPRQAFGDAVFAIGGLHGAAETEGRGHDGRLDELPRLCQWAKHGQSHLEGCGGLTVARMLRVPGSRVDSLYTKSNGTKQCHRENSVTGARQHLYSARACEMLFIRPVSDYQVGDIRSYSMAKQHGH